MTNRVQFLLPKVSEGGKQAAGTVRLLTEKQNSNGEWVEVNETTILKPGEVVEKTVHAKERFVIEEVADVAVAKARPAPRETKKADAEETAA